MTDPARTVFLTPPPDARAEIATRLLVAAMQTEPDLDPPQLVQVCVAMADLLLAELERTSPKPVLQ